MLDAVRYRKELNLSISPLYGRGDRVELPSCELRGTIISIECTTLRRALKLIDDADIRWVPNDERVWYKIHWDEHQNEPGSDEKVGPNSFSIQNQAQLKLRHKKPEWIPEDAAVAAHQEINGPPHRRADGTYVTDSGAVALYPEQYEEAESFYEAEQTTQLKCSQCGKQQGFRNGQGGLIKDGVCQICTESAADIRKLAAELPSAILEKSKALSGSGLSLEQSYTLEDAGRVRKPYRIGDRVVYFDGAHKANPGTVVFFTADGGIEVLLDDTHRFGNVPIGIFCPSDLELESKWLASQKQEPVCACDINFGHRPDCAWKLWNDQQS